MWLDPQKKILPDYTFFFAFFPLALWSPKESPDCLLPPVACSSAVCQSLCVLQWITIELSLTPRVMGVHGGSCSLIACSHRGSMLMLKSGFGVCLFVFKQKKKYVMQLGSFFEKISEFTCEFAARLILHFGCRTWRFFFFSSFCRTHI